MSITFRLFSACVALLILVAVQLEPCLGQPFPLSQLSADRARGATRDDDLASKLRAAGGYGKRWALIIGIDYKNGSIRSLNNAEKDAQDVYDMLVTHYGYNHETIKLLLGQDATRERIRSLLGGEFLGNTGLVKKDDSALVFFAGHGHRLTRDNEAVGAISPYDVKLKDQEPVYDTTLSFAHDLLDLLKGCAARHKLLLLNCCHSGEIFAEHFPQNDEDDRRAPGLLRMPACQALASCRANELDDDGKKGENSPFTASLLLALQLLPTQKDRNVYFTATELFSFMKSDFAVRRPGEQSPDLRSLTRQDGEFRFAPAEGADFSQFVVKDIDVRLLRAMVPGEYGNWWFDETPYFIPSLRKAILVNTPSRRGLYADVMSRCELLSATEEVIKRLEQEKAPGDLVRLRLHEARELLRPDRSMDYKQLREELIDELKAQKDLEATELHLLAVLQHSLGMKEAESTYEKAIEKYQADRGHGSPSEPQGSAVPLEALCHVDYGYYKFLLNENERAVEAYGIARTLCGSAGSSPTTSALRPFGVFVLCREADAWQRLGRWGMSKDRLDLAIHVAKEMDPEETSSLTAHVLSRRGWALMEQWKFKDAVKDFKNSNAILGPFLKAGDPNALLLEFDNRQGMAIADRCQGNAKGAAVEFRQITLDLATRFQELREGTDANSRAAEIKPRLIEQWVSSVHRLVDCNLFAEPRDRDLAEATDDLRRVIRTCSVMPANQRAVTEAALLYEQAVVLSLRSSIQDLSLAAAYRKKADSVAALLDGAQANLLEMQSKLAPPIVELYCVCADTPDCLQSRRDALAKLRCAIQGLREKSKSNDRRDCVEFLMFASRILLDEGIDADRYETLMDSEMLLGFCRRALLCGTGECLRYLRPYYDAVMEAKLRLQPKHVKELLEVQWEATQGTIFRKDPDAIPVIAIYVLKDNPYLFVDIPGGLSKSYCLDAEYSVREIQTLLAGNGQLELPREVVRKLEAFPFQTPGDRLVRCWYEDPMRPVVHTAAYGGEPLPGTQDRTPALFKLPEGFHRAATALPTSGVPSGPGKLK